MSEQTLNLNALSAKTAYQLLDVSKAARQYQVISPRWLTKSLEWKGLDCGIFIHNKVKQGQPCLMYYVLKQIKMKSPKVL